jgi:hypothetical protein
MCESIKKGTLVEMLEDSAMGGLWKRGSIGRTTVDFPTLQNNVCVADFNIPENPFRSASTYNTVRAGKIWAIADDTETKPEYKIYTPTKGNPMKDEKMTREEALAAIEKLQKYVESIPKNNHPEHYKAGQVYRENDGDLGMVYNTGNGKCELVYLMGGFVGGCCSRDSLFGSSPENFEYLGMFNEVFTRKVK